MNNLLIIAHMWPDAQATAAGVRMQQIIKLFQELGYQVHLVATGDIPEKVVNQQVTYHQIALNCDSFDSWVKSLNPAVVIYDRFMMQEQFGWRVHEHCPDAVNILDTEDLHFLRHDREQALKLDAKQELLSSIAVRELTAIYRCDLTLVISEYEMQLLVNKYNIDASLLFYLPFLLDETALEMAKNNLSIKDKKDFVFIGTCKHKPNVDAIKLLKKHIWPKIRRQLPKAALHIYGSYPSQEVLQMYNEQEGFMVNGFVENAVEGLSKHKVMLAPLRFGAGLKGKIIDGMIAGTPAVMSPIAAEAMFGNLPPSGIICELDAFAQAAVNFYKDEKAQDQAKQAGITVLKNRFMAYAFAKAVQEKLLFLTTCLEYHRNNNLVGILLRDQLFNSNRYMSKWIEEKHKGKA